MPRTSAASREIVAEEYPGLRAVAFLRRAAGISRIRARDDDAGRCVRQAAHGALSAARARRARRRLARQAVPGHAVERRRGERRRRWCSKPITTALSGPAAGALGSAVVAEIAGFPNVVTLDAGGTSTDLCLIEGGRPHVTNGGAVGAFPGAHPDDRHRDHRHRRRLDRLDHAAKAISRSGPKSAGAEPGPMCYPNGGERADHHRRQSGARPHSGGADRRRHRARRRALPRRHRRARGAAARRA